MTVTWLISDSHFNHDKMPTYCQRPENFTDLIIDRWNQVVKPGDLVLHLGDVVIGNRRKIKEIMDSLSGRKVLILGNHDRSHGCGWWMNNGFHFACQALKYRNCWLSHEPSTSLADGCEINIHGHLHNFDPTHHPETIRRIKPWHRLFAVEYTNYFPVNFDKFVNNPDKFKARIHHG